MIYWSLKYRPVQNHLENQALPLLSVYPLHNLKFFHYQYHQIQKLHQMFLIQMDINPDRLSEKKRVWKTKCFYSILTRGNITLHDITMLQKSTCIWYSKIFMQKSGNIFIVSL